jgi:predicted NBD/HSP70 family sugar kinase
MTEFESPEAYHRLHIVVDLGATHYRIGSADHNKMKPGVIGETPRDASSILCKLCDGVLAVAANYPHPLSAVSIGCPGLITEDGAVYKSLHIPLSGCDLQSEMKERLGVDVRVLNDAKAQAIGYPSNYETLFYMTLGTGIGGAFIQKGLLVKGCDNFAGEIGHIPLSASGQVCACGESDCLDATASGWALAKRLGPNWFERELNTFEHEILQTAGASVGIAAALCAILLNPSVVVIGGHLTSNSHFRTGIQLGWRRRGWAQCELDLIEDTWPLACRGLTDSENKLKETKA